MKKKIKHTERRIQSFKQAKELGEVFPEITIELEPEMREESKTFGEQYFNQERLKNLFIKSLEENLATLQGLLREFLPLELLEENKWKHAIEEANTKGLNEDDCLTSIEISKCIGAIDSLNFNIDKYKKHSADTPSFDWLDIYSVSGIGFIVNELILLSSRRAIDSRITSNNNLNKSDNKALYKRFLELEPTAKSKNQVYKDIAKEINPNIQYRTNDFAREVERIRRAIDRQRE